MCYLYVKKDGEQYSLLTLKVAKCENFDLLFLR